MNVHPLFQKLLPILYEDGELLAIDKPAGVDVGGLPPIGVGGLPGEEATSLVEILKTVRGRAETLHPANRLSRFESGVLLLGKNPGATARIRALLKSFRLEQEYVAVVSGRMSRPTLLLDSQRGSAGESRTLGRAEGRSVRSLRTVHRSTRSAAPAIRTVIRRIEQGERRALIRCETNAPTTHALRAQLRSAGLRLVGDRVHDRSPRLMAHEDTFLQLSRVRLPIAGRKEFITIRSPALRGHGGAALGQAALRGERDVPRLLHAALARRLPCLLESDTDSFRLLTGLAEGLSGLVAEKYGPIVVLQVLDASPQWSEALPDIARWYRDILHVRTVYVKRFVKDRTQLNIDLQEALRSPKPLLGEPAPPEVEIVERGLRFAIRLYDGFSVGLFLDQRDNRGRIREMSPGKDVLNLFAYTCGFSVAAAAGGANSTVSVDVSPKHLEWGRANFAINSLDLTAHQFIRSDAAEYLRRAKRQGREFDIFILDPPSFAHGRKSRNDFSVLDDLADLVRSASEVLRSGGVLMVSANHRKLSRRGLLDRIRQGLGTRRWEVLPTPPLPPDFAVDPDHAKTVFVRIGITIASAGRGTANEGCVCT